MTASLGSTLEPSVKKMTWTFHKLAVLGSITNGLGAPFPRRGIAGEMILDFEPIELLVDKNMPADVDAVRLGQRGSIQVDFIGNVIVFIGEW